MFGDKVRARRREIGLSQEELAEQASIDVKTLRMIETGRRTPRPSTIRRLADALQLSGAARDEFVATAGGQTPAPSGPAQLPPDVYGFVGRVPQLDILESVTAAATTGPAAVVISAVSGSAGVGKTALAVHWGHRVRARFPDGQLYVNLRGFDPAGSALNPSEAVRGFLGALGVPPENVPGDLDAQVALYRSLLTGKRMLLVLDNARDSAQVRPLLPGANGCLVLVTSRNELTGLVAGHGARPLNLGLLSTGESRELLAGRLGEQRLAAEPDAVDEIITRCARLPLALTIVAARAAMRPQLPLVELAAELRDSRERLDALTGDDPASDVRSVFSWSSRALSPAASRLFRLLGLHPGPEVSVPAAASLSGTDPDTAAQLLAELTGASLLAENAPGRFTFHDLLRAYAGEQADGEPGEQRQAALRRMVDHYLHTALAADRILDEHRLPAAVTSVIDDGVVLAPLDDSPGALAWFTAEQPVLVAMVDQAARTGLDLRAWHLAWALATYFFRRWQGQDWVATQNSAMASAERLGDERLRVRTHNDLAGGFYQLGRLDEAEKHMKLALDVFATLGDVSAEAGGNLNLGKVLSGQGRYQDALVHNHRGYELFEQTGSFFGQAAGLNAIGWCHARLGDYEQGIAYCERALRVHAETRASNIGSEIWDSLGFAHHQLGHFTEAAHAYEQAATLFSESGDQYNTTLCLTQLGQVHLDAGDKDRTRAAWQRALDILEELQHEDAAALRERLSALG
ncbi:ATP-binding protein [Actinoplanes friuliensis]|uniref:SARP family transcriptional regulator n=1 Tax=Actinoplanes friuliensis DSM 7358 TaxID=1246995 RepID=U5VUZ2_9ACTN|nr:helix-turn-helix domain-containing protein [Actinoplanes friuliensis]AGZ40607.1 SARP family transcriptional regulator [Actinoplanes friuliensis DSM 7358]